MQQSHTLTHPGPAASAASGAYKVDITRGERIGRVSSEWFSRPDDERYLSLNALHAPSALAPNGPPPARSRHGRCASRPAAMTRAA